MFTLLEFETVESTSSLLKEHYASFPHFTVIRTDFQSGGRGQFDRTWDSLPGKNLLLSVLLKDIDIKAIDTIKQKTLDILLDVLSSYGIQARFKEPNDLYVGDDKICGILIETKSSHQTLDYVVIGIGLNVNQMRFGHYPATSIAKLLGKKIDMKIVFYNVILALEKTFK